MAVKKEHLVFGVIAVLFLLVVSYETLFFDPHTTDEHMAHHNEMHAIMAGRSGPSLLGFNILFWILVFALVYLLVKEVPRVSEKEDAAVRILKERYAKGEINQDEYLEKFRDLKEI
jgi:putative membrane protein